MASLTQISFIGNYNALSTHPDLKHRVHTFTLFVAPFTTALTVLILGDQLLELFLFEKVTLLPNTFPFPHTSQTFAMKNTSLIYY
jgi:hypothetical protein